MLILAFQWVKLTIWAEKSRPNPLYLKENLFFLHRYEILNVLEAEIRITLIFSPKSVACLQRIRYSEENRDI